MTVHYLDRHGRVTCLRRRHDSESGSMGSVTKWPEYVTCAGACATAAKADLIIADRERVAWYRPREIRAGDLIAQVTYSDAGSVVVFRTPPTLSIEDLERFAYLVGAAKERAELIEARQRHRDRYLEPGAPPDQERCQHHAARVRADGKFSCWTCAGEWDATPEGIAQAAAAAARPAGDGS